MIELKNVYAGYGRHPVLHGVCAQFRKGRLTSIIGPNGSGKSTLVKAVIGILPLFSGERMLDGAPAAALGRRELARHIAYLPQGRNTPDMTVEQMVLHGRFPHLSYPRGYSARDRQIASDSIRRMGLSQLAHQPLSALSGGMKQNAYIAMALTQETEYIFLDEPTTYLDIGHQLSLMRLLRELANEGRGIVAVMHDLPLALRFSDTVLVMKDGTLQAEMTPEELCRSTLPQRLFGVTVGVGDDGEYFYKY